MKRTRFTRLGRLFLASLLFHCLLFTRCSYMIIILFYYNKQLRLSGNTIHVIEDDAFVGLNNLITLALSYCGFNAMPSLAPVKDNSEILRLSYNYLIVIPEDYFLGFIRLMTISLDHNKLMAVPNITPLMAQLIFIQLDKNGVASFEPFLTCTTLPTMHQLNVNNNKITYLSRDIFGYWPELMILHLKNNLLKRLEDLSGLIRDPSASLTVRYCGYNFIHALSMQILNSLYC